MKRVEAVLREGVEQRVFEAGRAVVLHRGREVFSGGSVGPDAVFDLASITKVMSTTALFCHFAAEGRVSLTELLSSQVPESAAGSVTLEDLLTHRAGLEPYRCFFADVINAMPALLQTPRPENEGSLRRDARAALMKRLFSVAPTQPPRTAAVYSDIGFQLLGEVVERVGNAPLDELFLRHVAAPLKLSAAAGYRRISARPPLTSSLVSTGGTRPREPAPGQEGMWSCALGPSQVGEVDDDNAWVMDGVSGHAGLFATAGDVAAFGLAVQQGRVKCPAPSWSRDASTPGSTRTIGFDTPSSDGSSVGARFGAAPPGAVGHLGFTGTSVWVDFARELVVVLLTNRVIFGRANLRLRDFRPRFHDAVLDDLAL